MQAPCRTTWALHGHTEVRIAGHGIHNTGIQSIGTFTNSVGGGRISNAFNQQIGNQRIGRCVGHRLACRDNAGTSVDIVTREIGAAVLGISQVNAGSTQPAANFRRREIGILANQQRCHARDDSRTCACARHVAGFGDRLRRRCKCRRGDIPGRRHQVQAGAVVTTLAGIIHPALAVVTSTTISEVFRAADGNHTFIPGRIMCTDQAIVLLYPPVIIAGARHHDQASPGGQGVLDGLFNEGVRYMAERHVNNIGTVIGGILDSLRQLGAATRIAETDIHKAYVGFTGHTGNERVIHGRSDNAGDLGFMGSHYHGWR